MKRFLPAARIAALVSVLAACGGGSKAPTTTSSSAAPTLHPGQAHRRLRPSRAVVLERPGVRHDAHEPRGLRVRARPRRREAARDQQEQREAPAGAFRDDSPRRQEAVRLRDGGDDDHRAARAGRRLLEPVLRREPGRADRQGRDEADLASPISRACRRARRRPRPASAGSIHKLRPAKQPLVYPASRAPPSTRLRPARARRSSSTCRSSTRRAQKQPGAYGGVVGQIDTNEGYGAVFAKGKPAHPVRQQGAQDAAGQRDDREADRSNWFGFDPATVPVLK